MSRAASDTYDSATRSKASRKGAATRKRLALARAAQGIAAGSQADRVAQGEQIAAMIARIEAAIAAKVARDA